MQIKRKLKYVSVSLFSLLTGWRFDKLPEDIEQKYILIGFPHTSNFDAPLGIAFSFYNQIPIRPFIKKEALFFPFNFLFKALNAIVIERSKKQGLIERLTEEFNKQRELQIFIFPEGSRRKVEQLKMGFWHIANQAKVPIVMLFKNKVQKRILYVGKLIPSNNMETDFVKIKDHYRTAGYVEIDGFSIQPPL